MVGSTNDRWRWSSNQQGRRGEFAHSRQERHARLEVVSPALLIEQQSRLGGSVTAPSSAVYSPPTIDGGESFYLHVKRASDIVNATAGLLLLLPLYLLVAVLVALDSPGPVFHRRRVLARQRWVDGGETGQQPVTFDAFKFRTMRADADEYLSQNPQLMASFLVDYKLDDDPRVTRLGRFLRRSSMDELPQLWNILVGQMSLVGPRMITPGELSRYEENGAALLSVTPGLTGLWQVSGRTSTGYRERVRLDVAYIHGRTLRLDTEILLKTVACVLAGRGAV